MIFLLLTAIILHILSYISWVGGMLFLSGVYKPISIYFGDENEKSSIPVLQRFLGFTWMSVWTLIVTGIILFLLGMKINWWQNITDWELLILTHSIFILAMILTSMKAGKILKQNDDSKNIIMRFNKLNTLNVIFSFADIFTISGMVLIKWVR